MISLVALILNLCLKKASTELFKIEAFLMPILNLLIIDPPFSVFSYRLLTNLVVNSFQLLNEEKIMLIS